MLCLTSQMFLEIFKIFFKVFIFILFGPRSQALLLLDGTPNQLTNEPQPYLLVALPPLLVLSPCCSSGGFGEVERK